MITLITGTPGSGKTLFAVTKILEYVEQNKKLLQDGKEPRMIYADIDGLNIPGVEPAPDDWRDTPDGSIIFYDEIQQRDVYKKSRYDNDICDALQIHRHTGHDIYGITQFPVLLHPNFRAVVGMHYHLHRGWGLSSATVFSWAYCVDAPNAPSNKKLAEHTERFNYDKKVYQYYKSATVHTHKKRIPKQLFFILAGVLLFGYFAVKMLFFNDNFFTKLYGIETPSTNKQTANDTPTDNPVHLQDNHSPADSQDLKQADALDVQAMHDQSIINRRIILYSQNLPQDYEIRRTDPALQVRAVVSMGGKCRVYNAYGDAMIMNYEDCTYYINETGRVYKSDQQSNGVQFGNDYQYQSSPPPPAPPQAQQIDQN